MHGQLFTSNFLSEGIQETPGWASSELAFIDFREALSAVFAGVRADLSLNEAQTEDEIIVPVLEALGWKQRLRQANASSKGREDVPDFLLFTTPQAKQSAKSETRDNRQYRHGALIVEAKRWLRPLDRGHNADPLDPGTPSSQMLRYLSRVEVVSDRAVQWGVLTNGAVWRLYWQSARSLLNVAQD